MQLQYSVNGCGLGVKRRCRRRGKRRKRCRAKDVCARSSPEEVHLKHLNHLAHHNCFLFRYMYSQSDRGYLRDGKPSLNLLDQASLSRRETRRETCMRQRCESDPRGWLPTPSMHTRDRRKDVSERASIPLSYPDGLIWLSSQSTRIQYDRQYDVTTQARRLRLQDGRLQEPHNHTHRRRNSG